MLVEKVDTVGGEPAERALDRLADVLRPAVQARDRAVLDLEAELGRDDDAIALALERAAQQLLVRVRAVDLGRVEEGHAELDGPVDGGDGLALVALLGGAVGLAHPHAAEAERGDLQAARSEFAVSDPFQRPTICCRCSG